MAERVDIALVTLLEVFEMVPRIPALTGAQRPAAAAPRDTELVGHALDAADMVPIPGITDTPLTSNA